MKKISILFLLVVFMSSCATILSGTRKRVILDANIEQVSSLTIDGVRHKNVSFPYPVKIKRGFEQTIIKGVADGYEPYSLRINKKFNPVAVINLVDILGWGIDAATGAIMKPEFSIYELEFIPIK